MAKSLRLAFMGTPDYALPSLNLIHQSHHQLLMVWTKQPSARGGGRGLKQQESAVSRWAKENNVPMRTCAHLKAEEDAKLFRELDLDAALVVSFGIILPEKFLTAPRLGVLNLHPSLLPRWRGAAPIERTVWAGDEKIGITIMLLGAGLDDGPILSQQTLPIGEANAGSLKVLTSKQGAALLLETLDRYAAGEIKPQPQDDTLATYAKKLSADEQAIDWTKPAAEILLQVRALAPRPAAWFSYRGVRISLLDARLAAPAGGASGEIIDGKGALIACSADETGKPTALELLTLQRQGRRVLSKAEFLRGFTFTRGDKVS